MARVVSTTGDITPYGLQTINLTLGGTDPADFDVPCEDEFLSVCNFHLDFADFAITGVEAVAELQGQFLGDESKK